MCEWICGNEAKGAVETPGNWRCQEYNTSTEEGWRLWMDSTKERGQVICDQQGQRGEATQLLWNSHPITICPWCWMWSYRMQCLLHFSPALVLYFSLPSSSLLEWECLCCAILCQKCLKILLIFTGAHSSVCLELRGDFRLWLFSINKM